MALMALDHVRDYLTDARFDPMDLSKTTAALFMTRWVTHYCAPVFMFLAGVGAWLYQSRGRSKLELARFLLTRGLWLILLEFTVVRFGWYFSFPFGFFSFDALVLWALGLSMISLAALVFLPRGLIATGSIAVIAGHHLLDGIRAERFGSWRPVWNVLHEPGSFQLAGQTYYVLYCAIPWVAVMSAGYAFGSLLSQGVPGRQRTALRIGLIATGLFVAVRALNFYGDPTPWASQHRAGFTILSFLNTTKYAPSFCFLLMTLGPAIVVLSRCPRGSGPISRLLVSIGRVPFFYYILHIYLIHVVAIGLGLAQGFPAAALSRPFPMFPPGYGVGLPYVYLAWIAVVLILYVPCRWFAEYKGTHSHAWLSYV
jgi:uncharacterized membrane protein